MLKRYILCYIVGLCCAVHLYGQQDTILLRINDEKISRSEFESAYEKYISSNPNDKKPDDFLSRFIDDKLKIAEAKIQGLNTTPEFRQKVEEYNETLQASSPDARNAHSILSVNEGLKKTFSADRFLVMQIYKYLPQNGSAIELEKNKQLMQRLYSELVNNSAADFSAYVEEHSDDKRIFEFGIMEMSLEFEQTVLAMRKGEISAPFLTSQGLHIVKVLDVKNGMPDSEQKKVLQSRVKRRYTNGADAAFLQRLKDTYSYIPELSNINELLTLGRTEKVLFTLNGEIYTGRDFSYFAEANPKGLKRQFDDFVTKSLVDCERQDLAAKRPEVHMSLQEYENELLLSEINRREVTDKARTDQAGLAAYFSVHKKDYRWAYPRFRGVVLHTRDKAIIPEAKKLVKKRPSDEWGELIESYFNLGIVQHVEVEQGTFKVGDNAYVDDRVFKKGHAASPSSYPFTALIGKKIKGPEDYKEILSHLIPDYEKFLETQWLKRLRKAYSVEINEEVLKTVNNH